MRTIEWKDGVVLTIDQTLLPGKLVFLKLHTCQEIAHSIKSMKIRGAPLIGVAAAYGLALTAFHSQAQTGKELVKEIEAAAELLKRTRPTGVNLYWAVNRILDKLCNMPSSSAKHIIDSAVAEAEKIADEDVTINREIGRHGSALIRDGDTVMTHCNAGRLATVDYGTALGVIRSAWEQGKRLRVFATETRPRLQGSRLTAYELIHDNIPTTLITDGMVGYVLSKRLINQVIVGADRIMNDAVVNKIGTFTVAVLAHEHQVPFYVAAPISTFDLSQSSKSLVIEERSSDEVTYFGSEHVAPSGVDVLNPSFDITPMKYVTGIICEKGFYSPKDLRKLEKWRK